MQKLFPAFIFSFLIPLTAAAAPLPAAEDINNLAKTAKLTVDTFMQDSFPLRMEYEYSGKLLTPEAREKLKKIAQKTGSELKTVIDRQQKLKTAIEDYTGDDWEQRYGSNGLWRKLSSEFYAAILNECRIDFYRAITADSPEQNELLNYVLSEVNSLNTNEAKFLSADAQILKGQIYAVFSHSDPVYRQLAIDQFDSPAIRSYIVPGSALRIMLEKAKLGIQPDPCQLEKLVLDFKQTGPADDFEFVLPLAFLQRRCDPCAFEKLVQTKPQTKDFIGSLVLSDLSCRAEQGQLTQEALQQESLFDAELAVETAWKNETWDYKKLFGCLLNEKNFRTPLILYVAAAKSAPSSPAKAVNLLIEASNCQRSEKNITLDIGAEKIAAQAARLAYNLSASDSNNCPLALSAFENYFTMPDSNDEQIEYLYSSALNDCGQMEKSDKLLQKITDRPAGNYRNKAKLDLIVHAIRPSQSQNQKQPENLIGRLKNLISDCNTAGQIDSQVRIDALNLYCRVLLEPKDPCLAQKVLDVLSDDEIRRDPNLNIVKSKAFGQLGRFDESAGCLLAAFDTNNCRIAEPAMELLSEITDKIDLLEASNLDFSKSLQLYKKLALNCYDCLEGQPHRRAGSQAAEISIFEAAKDNEKLLTVEKFLNNITKEHTPDSAELLRCRARLFTEQGKFQEAAQLWSKLCEIQKSISPSQTKRTWRWWQAKFFELDCLSKLPQTKKEDLLHSLDVLENSFTDIPPFWAEKLKSLKK